MDKMQFSSLKCRLGPQRYIFFRVYWLESPLFRWFVGNWTVLCKLSPEVRILFVLLIFVLLERLLSLLCSAWDEYQWCGGEVNFRTPSHSTARCASKSPRAVCQTGQFKSSRESIVNHFNNTLHISPFFSRVW